MSELTTQLEQARQEITEKEAESRAWEEEVAGLSQQLKETNNKLEVSYIEPSTRVYFRPFHCNHFHTHCRRSQGKL